MEEKNTENFSDENKVVRVKLVRHQAGRMKLRQEERNSVRSWVQFWPVRYSLPLVSHCLHLFSREIPVCQPVQIK